MRSRRLGLAVAALLASTLLVAGCGTSSSSPESASLAPASPSPEPVDPAVVVAAIEIARSDLPAGYGPNRMRKGDEVDGQVTMDMCGTAFPSEGLRTARHQVAYALGDPESPDFDPVGDRVSVMSEAVAYAPGGAEQALDEVREAIATCPDEYVDAGLVGAPPTWTTLTPMASSPDWQEDHVAVVAEHRFVTGVSFRMALVYQRRGDLLAMAYVMTTENGRGTDMARRMASLLSSQLDAAPVPMPARTNA